MIEEQYGRFLPPSLVFLHSVVFLILCFINGSHEFVRGMGLPLCAVWMLHQIERPPKHDVT